MPEPQVVAHAMTAGPATHGVRSSPSRLLPVLSIMDDAVGATRTRHRRDSRALNTTTTRVVRAGTLGRWER